MLEFCLLSSGSRANSMYVSDGSTRILIDAGLSAREISKRLAGIGIEPESIDAVVISHEHSDHVKGALQFARTRAVPLYANDRTYRAWLSEPVPDICTERFDNNSTFAVGSLILRAYPMSHDARDPVVFEVQGGGVSLGVVTDLGFVDRGIKEGMQNVDALVIEANHDPLLLQDAPYPGALKSRIRGQYGHLSNEQAVEFVRDTFSARGKPLQALIAAHVSENSNHPDVIQELFHPLLEEFVSTPRFAIGNAHVSTEVFSLKTS